MRRMKRTVIAALLLTIIGLGMVSKQAEAANRNWTQRVTWGYVIAMDSNRANALANNINNRSIVVEIVAAFVPWRFAQAIAPIMQVYAWNIRHANRYGTGVYILVTWWGSMWFEAQ
jgi:hypothetical protein